MIRAPAPAAGVQEPLHAACAGGDAASVRALLGQPDAPDLINRKDSSGMTPLAHACANGREEVVRMFLAHPALVWGDEDPIETSPLVLATREGHTDVLKLLLSHIRPSMAAANGNGTLYTAAEVATHNKDSDLWLIIQGKVYNVTKFIDEHPGGVDVLLEHGGADHLKQGCPSPLTGYQAKMPPRPSKMSDTPMRRASSSLACAAWHDRTYHGTDEVARQSDWVARVPSRGALVAEP